jgi:hypothetical protein
MSSESVCQVARSWVDVASFHTRLFGVVYFAIASIREFLDTPSYTLKLSTLIAERTLRLNFKPEDRLFLEAPAACSAYK